MNFTITTANIDLTSATQTARVMVGWMGALRNVSAGEAAVAALCNARCKSAGDVVQACLGLSWDMSGKSIIGGAPCLRDWHGYQTSSKRVSAQGGAITVPSFQIDLVIAAALEMVGY